VSIFNFACRRKSLHIGKKEPPFFVCDAIASKPLVFIFPSNTTARPTASAEDPFSTLPELGNHAIMEFSTSPRFATTTTTFQSGERSVHDDSSRVIDEDQERAEALWLSLHLSAASESRALWDEARRPVSRRLRKHGRHSVVAPW